MFAVIRVAMLNVRLSRLGMRKTEASMLIDKLLRIR